MMTEYKKSIDLFKTKAQNFADIGHNRVSAVISKAELHSLPEHWKRVDLVAVMADNVLTILTPT